MTREMDLELVLPGHGDPVLDHRSLIDSRFEMHARRADKIHRLVSERPRTAYKVAQALWGNIAVTQAFLTLSEVLGHMDLLLGDGRVRATTGWSCSRPRASRRPAAEPRGERPGVWPIGGSEGR
jgi:hypothetical protein